jgi:hypothetical protein
MAVTNTLPITQAIQNWFQTLANADGACGTLVSATPANTKLLGTAGANGSILKALMVFSDDTAARVLDIFISPDAGTTRYFVGSVAVPITAGSTGAIINVDALANAFLVGFSIDQGGKNIVELAPNNKVYIGAQVAVTAAKTVMVFGMVEDY